MNNQTLECNLETQFAGLSHQRYLLKPTATPEQQAAAVTVNLLHYKNIGQDGKLSGEGEACALIINPATLERYKIQRGDIMVSLRFYKSFQSCLIQKELEELSSKPAIASNNVAILRPHQGDIFGRFLIAYFNSEIGQTQIMKIARSASKVRDVHWINLGDLRNLKIPIYPEYKLLEVTQRWENLQALRQKHQQELLAAKQEFEQSLKLQ